MSEILNDVKNLIAERDAALAALRTQLLGGLSFKDISPDEEQALFDLAVKCRNGMVEAEVLSALTPILCAWLLETLESTGAPNLVSFMISNRGHDAAEVTIRRAHGKTSEELRAEEKARADKAEAELAVLRASLARQGGEGDV